MTAPEPKSDPAGTQGEGKLSETEEAVTLANRVLERPWADPDDDLNILARQFLRSREREVERTRLRFALTALVASLEGDIIPVPAAVDTAYETAANLLDELAVSATARRQALAAIEDPKGG